MEILNLQALKSEPTKIINNINQTSALGATVTKAEDGYVVYFHQIFDIIKNSKEDNKK